MTKKAVVDHEGNEFRSIIDMCRYYGVPYERYRDRIKKYGWSDEHALTKPVGEYGTNKLGRPKGSKNRKNANNKSARTVSGPVKDHEGREFKSLYAFAKFYGLAYNTTYKCYRRGDDIEKIIGEAASRKTGQPFAYKSDLYSEPSKEDKAAHSEFVLLTKEW